MFDLHRFKLHRHLVDGTVKSVWFRQVFGLLRVQFRQVFGLLGVRFRQVSLHMHICVVTTDCIATGRMSLSSDAVCATDDTDTCGAIMVVIVCQLDLQLPM